MKYGNPPKMIGHFPLSFPEVMYYLYLPLKVPGVDKMEFGDDFARLKPLGRMLYAIYEDDKEFWNQCYVYATVKRMVVGNGITPNRPGWHADGFGTDDRNYIWYDSVPTVFNMTPNLHISNDHLLSLEQFEKQVDPRYDAVYPCEHLLRLDPSVVHRVGDTPADTVMRTFVKISLSKNQYNLKDNSINQVLSKGWKFYDRSIVRNDPTAAQRDYHVPKDDHFA